MERILLIILVLDMLGAPAVGRRVDLLLYDFSDGLVLRGRETCVTGVDGRCEVVVMRRERGRVLYAALLVDGAYMRDFILPAGVERVEVLADVGGEADVYEGQFGEMGYLVVRSETDIRSVVLVGMGLLLLVFLVYYLIRWSNGDN